MKEERQDKTRQEKRREEKRNKKRSRDQEKMKRDRDESVDARIFFFLKNVSEHPNPPD